MVSTRSMNTRSTRNGSYTIIAPVYIIKTQRKPIIKKQKDLKPRKRIVPELVTTTLRRSKRISSPVKDSFNTDLYGRDSNGKRNVYHGLVGDRWQRDFDGLEKPSHEELLEEFIEDKIIEREMKHYDIGIAGYVLDNFIVNEISEAEYESESEDESRESDDEEDGNEDCNYWCNSDDE